MNGAILNFNLLLGKECQMGLFYIFMFGRGVGYLLSGCRNSDWIDFTPPCCFCVAFSLDRKTDLPKSWCFVWFGFIFLLKDEYLQNSETIDSRSNHKTAILNTIYPLM